MERLKFLRQSKKLLQKDIAEAINVGRTTYLKYENGTTEPSMAILVKLADYFDVSTDYILGRTNICQNPVTLTRSQKEQEIQQKKITKQEETLLETFRSTTEFGRQRIIQSALNIYDDLEKKNSEKNTRNSS